MWFFVYIFLLYKHTYIKMKVVLKCKIEVLPKSFCEESYILWTGFNHFYTVRNHMMYTV